MPIWRLADDPRSDERVLLKFRRRVGADLGSNFKLGRGLVEEGFVIGKAGPRVGVDT